jgi:O-antigen/teichoic acid export membrane protein
MSSDTARAAGLGIAVAAANGFSLLLAVVFARGLGADEYGDLASLLAAFLILSIPGTAIQASIARDVASAGDGAAAIAGRARTLARALGVVSGAVLAVALVARQPLAHVTGTPAEGVGAALTVGAAAAWLVVSIQRGALQGLGQLSLVGGSIVSEAVGRFLLGLALLAAGAGAAGAVAAFLLALVLVALVLDRRLPARTTVRHRVAELLAGAGVPTVAVTLLAVLQNVDVIVVRHLVSTGHAGAYAAASLTAKGIIWVAVGLGLFLLPEASRRAAAGADDEARRLLVRCLVLALAVACLAIGVFALAGPELLRLTFGPKYVVSTELLITLGAAMGLLAIAQLASQYLLALRRAAFLAPLALAALAVTPVLAEAGPGLMPVASALVAVNGALAFALMIVTARSRGPERSESLAMLAR